MPDLIRHPEHIEKHRIPAYARIMPNWNCRIFTTLSKLMCYRTPGNHDWKANTTPGRPGPSVERYFHVLKKTGHT